MRCELIVSIPMLVCGVWPAWAQVGSVDLSRYVRIGRYNLPAPGQTPAPVGSLLAEEASGVTYNRDTGTLFVVGDRGTSVVQVTKTGALIDSMTLAAGSSPQGTAFYDVEGITWIGNGQFVIVEERYRIANRFVYTAGTTLGLAGAQRVTLGTSTGNSGLEGVAHDPLTGGFIFVKEKSPQGVFQTTINFANGTASNGSPTTANSVNLFSPALLGVTDLADVYALSALPSLAGHPDYSRLLILSQESGRVLKVDRSGNIHGVLVLPRDPDNPLSIEEQHHEGLTMDDDGLLYIVSEAGGGAEEIPQLWVFAPPRYLCGCAADFNADGGVDGADVDAFFASWEAARSCADVNEDGGIDGADVDAFFSRWEAGGCE